MTTEAAAQKANRGARQGYYPILDALRFVLAFSVVVSHFGMVPLFGDPRGGTGFWLLFKRLWDTLLFGTPAVIVFFVISGFCIHLPFRGTGSIGVGRYYLRRYTRILIPVAGALLVYRLTGQHLIFWGEKSILWQSVLWSLLCEEIYYALYPLLRLIRNKLGWKVLLGISFAVGIAIASTHLHAASWHDFGPLGTAFLLLPVWLLGCLLAEQSETLVDSSPRFSIWFWRFLAWLGCWTAEMLNFKLHIYSAQTMIWFGVLAYFWLRQEVAYGKSHSPNRYLVAAGAWSYSLYLVHAPLGVLFAYIPIPSLGPIPNWFLLVSFTLALAYLFYLLVERPSHRLARKFKVRGATTSAVMEKIPVAISPVPNLPDSEEVRGG